MQKSNYMLNMSIKISSLDDVEARKEVQSILQEMNVDLFDGEISISLKEIYNNKPPRKVSLELSPEKEVKDDIKDDLKGFKEAIDFMKKMDAFEERSSKVNILVGGEYPKDRDIKGIIS